MFIPRGKTVHENLATSYVVVDALVADLCEGGFSGVVEVVLRDTDSFIVINGGNVAGVIEKRGPDDPLVENPIESIERDSGALYYTRTTLAKLAERSRQERGRVSIYSYPAEKASAIARRVNAKSLYVGLSTDFTDLEKMILKLVRERDREWFVDINIGGVPTALIHMRDGAYHIFNSEETAMDEESDSLDSANNKALGKLLYECNQAGTTIDVYFSRTIGAVEPEKNEVEVEAEIAASTKTEIAASTKTETAASTKTETAASTKTEIAASTETTAVGLTENATATGAKTDRIEAPAEPGAGPDPVENLAKGAHAGSHVDSSQWQTAVATDPFDTVSSDLDSDLVPPDLMEDDFDRYEDDSYNVRTAAAKHSGFEILPEATPVSEILSSSDSGLDLIEEAALDPSGSSSDPGLDLIEEAALDPAVGTQRLRLTANTEAMAEAKRLMGEIARTIEEAAQAVDRPESFSMSLRAGQLKVADRYPFLDPFAGEIEYLTGEIVFAGQATVVEFIEGLAEALNLAVQSVVKSTAYPDRFRAYVTEDLKKLLARERQPMEALGLDQVIEQIVRF